MFETIAWISLGIAFFCSIVIAVDVVRHPQKMGVMNIVWPVTALYGSVFALWAYFRIGRKKAKDAQQEMSEEQHKRMMKEAKEHPKPSQTGVAASHCGAGCTLGDIVADFAVFGFALTLWGSDLWASFVIDYILAWLLGIVFQYFTIAPMRGISGWEGIWAAIKADTLSITAWQLGMYGWMLLTYFVIFPHPHLQPTQAGYWLMMQFAMVAGLLHRVSHELHPRENRAERGDGMKAVEIVALSAPKPSALLAQLLEHRAEFLGFLTRQVGDPAAAEDILQAAYTKALEKGEQIQNTESVVAWFYRMLRNALVGPLPQERCPYPRPRPVCGGSSPELRNRGRGESVRLRRRRGPDPQAGVPDRPGADRSWRRVDCRLRTSRGAQRRTTLLSGCIGLAARRRRSSPRSAVRAQITNAWIAPVNARCKRKAGHVRLHG